MPDQPQGARPPAPWAALTALGIVYGDLGTSPLYTLQTVVGAMGGHFTREGALGVLSLIVWTLIVTISVKYCLFVMRADNNGEGGILALMSLVGANDLKGRQRVLAMLGLLGAALIYGDGAITPSISVLSALEGVNVVTSQLKPYIVPLALAILVLLFLAQRLGTARIGDAFGPIMLVWFIVIAVLGLMGVIAHPAVLAAINPYYGFRLLLHGGAVAPLVLGGVFLCITGGEALYADMGHIGKGPIRFSWYVIVLPALLLSYAGQTGLLLDRGTISDNPFFEQGPRWAVYPLVALATVATIIASQAIITGSFSMTRQAIQLRWLPAMGIRQTSDRAYGQIYVPVVNWLMMFATVGITLAFKTADNLAGAYGTAVSTTMLITTLLLTLAMVKVWRWPPAACIAGSAVFLIVDTGFFGANLLKIADGGWLPLSLGLILFLVMTTWRTGVDAIGASLARTHQSPEQFLEALKEGKAPRTPGSAVFLSRSAGHVPQLVMDHVKFTGSLHERVAIVTVDFEERPRTPDEERITAQELGAGVWCGVVRFGFIEIPDLHEALKCCQALAEAVDLDKAYYFGARDLVARLPGSRVLSLGRLGVFAFLYRNALKMIDRFSLPKERVLEVAREIEI
jgi:KUP system potassium uptake protein